MPEKLLLVTDKDDRLVDEVYVIVENVTVVEDGDDMEDTCLCGQFGFYTDLEAVQTKVNQLNEDYNNNLY